MVHWQKETANSGVKIIAANGGNDAKAFVLFFVKQDIL